MSRPIFMIVAGIMGSGKSSLIRSGVIHDVAREIKPFSGSLRIFNVDERAKLTRSFEGCVDNSWIEAVIEVETLIDWHITARKNIGFETVLGSDKYNQRVMAAVSNSFYTMMVYVSVESQDLAQKRVRSRLEEGGHGADFKSFDFFWNTSLENFKWMFKTCDYTVIYDTTSYDADDGGYSVPIFAGNTSKSDIVPLRENVAFNQIKNLIM